MKNKIAWLILSIFPVFYLIFLLFKILTKHWPIENPELLNNLFLFLSGISFIMVFNLFIVYILKPYYTGIVFMAWSMIKLMFIMGFFAIYIMPKGIELSNHFIIVLTLTYLAYLIYEMIFTVLLLKK